MTQFVQSHKTMETAKAGINHLPLELLSHIFVLCTHEPDEEFSDTDIQVVAPTVCRYWRKVALVTPTLWTKIRIFKHVPCKRTALYLKRAGPTVPLDVEILIAAPQKVGKRSPIDQLLPYSKRVWIIFDFILEHGGSPSRWRSLELSTNVFASYLALIELLSKARLSSLESMQFILFGPWLANFADREMFFESRETRTSSRRLLFAKPPPRLRSVVLEGVMSRHLFGDISRPRLVGLTNINITLGGWHPEVKHIYSMLAASPQLATLRISSAEANAYGEDNTAITNTPPSSRITLSYLRSLSLTDMTNPAWNLSVIQIFKAPALHHLNLSFRFDRDGNQSLIDYVSNQLDQSAPYFPVTLSEVSVFGENPDLEPLLRAYPNITALRTASPTALLRRPWLVPNLANVEIAIQDASELKDLVLGRCRDGLPLKTVQVIWLGDDSSLSEDDKEQMRSMVDLTVSVEKAL